MSNSNGNNGRSDDGSLSTSSGVDSSVSSSTDSSNSGKSSDDSSSSGSGRGADDGYRFTVNNGTVTSVTDVVTGQRVDDSTNTNERWTVQNGQYLKTETEVEHGQTITKVTVYQDTNNDGIYFETSESHRQGNVQIDTLVVSGTRSSTGHSADSSYERIRFDDGCVALDIQGNAGEAYRLYKAAFDRVPDEEGLGFWIKQLDDGASLESVASGFTSSAEFSQRYGSSPSNSSFVNNLYLNVLDRLPDQSGLDFWVHELQSNSMDRNQVLMSFSESNENQLAVVGQIQQGINYQEFVG